MFQVLGFSLYRYGDVYVYLSLQFVFKLEHLANTFSHSLRALHLKPQTFTRKACNPETLNPNAAA